MWQSWWRGSPGPERSEEERELAARSSHVKMEEDGGSPSEEESANAEGKVAEGFWGRMEEEKESATHYPASGFNFTTSILSPEIALASTWKRPLPQLIPISELKSFPTPAGTNNTPSPSLAESQLESQPDCKIHAVDETMFHLGFGWYCLCSTRFTRKCHLNRHIKNFNREPLFPCKWCSLKFLNLTRLRRHMLNTHNGPDPFLVGVHGCNECGMMAKNFEELKAHRLANHPNWTEKVKSVPHAVDETAAAEGHFRCTCGRGFAKARYLTWHVSIHTGPADFRCDLCPGQFRTRRQLQVHYRRVHKLYAKDNKRFGCSVCARFFQNMKDLDQHMQREHPCSDVLPRYQPPKPEEELHGPSKRHTGHGVAPGISGEDESLVFRCLCGSGYLSKHQLLQHIQNSQGHVSLKCSHCQGEFVRHAQLKYLTFGCHACGRIWP